MMTYKANIRKPSNKMGCRFRLFAICAASLFAGLGNAEAPIQTGFVFSYGLTTENYCHSWNIINPDRAGRIYQFGFQAVQAGKLVRKEGGGGGVSIYYSPATIKFDDDFVIRNDTVLEGQKVDATHWGFVVNGYYGELGGMLRFAAAIGYEWFTFSNQNTGGNAGFRHIPAYVATNGVFEVGAIIYKTIGPHFVVQAHPYIRLSVGDYTVYNPSLNQGSFQIGTMLSFVVQN